MSNPAISPAEADKAVRTGRAILIDIRERAEHARASIPGAVLAPLSELDGRDFADERAQASVAIFHCHSGMRTKMNLARLRATGFARTQILDGGLVAWQRAGLPVRSSNVRPAMASSFLRRLAYAAIPVGIAIAATASRILGGLIIVTASVVLLAQGGRNQARLPSDNREA